ncbi:ATP-binding protein [Bradyrhizobium ottawaense]|uniref:ATP-binding protein n=1 Tax=Bradyrhizobium ottawaense TaxID=931866 RepID=UPI001BACE798|nr:sensor histidine kinase [Bradyrhizobium ottawaense]MBR1290164.1 sensor histidine kinase [Bradyrhizobium ottawaense]
MADHDSSLELRIDTRVVRQLGAELITDPEQALLELVKNSYDADADRCRVQIDTSAKEYFAEGKRMEAPPVASNDVSSEAPTALTGRITIEDDGPGITLEEIKARWLLISGSEKRPDSGMVKSSTKKGRTPLGDKGIGRLGTMRLGDCVQFVSRPKGSTKEASGVEFQWSEFDAAKTLNQVPVREVSASPTKGFSTRVMIEGLEDANHWKSPDQSELQARISRLISPFSKEHPLRVSISIDGQELELQRLKQDLDLYSTGRHSFSLKRVIEKEKPRDTLELTTEITADFFGEKWSADNESSFFSKFTKRYPKFGLARVAGDATQKRWIYRIVRKVDCREIKDYQSDNYPGDFSGSIYSLNFRMLPNADDTTQSSDQQVGATPPSGSLKSLFQKLAGVSIYRDGFGVRIDPDWLDMSANVTSGGSWYGLRRTNTVGHIDITSRGNASLVEKSDREGFVDTAPWRQFLLLAKKLRDEINDIYETLRRGFNDSRKPKTESAGKAPTPEGAIRELSIQAKFGQDVRSTLESQQAVLEKAEELFSNATGISAKEAQSFKDQTRIALKAIQGFRKRESAASVDASVELLREEIQALRSQVRTAYDFIAAGMAAETLAHEVHPLLDRASELILKSQRSAQKSGLTQISNDLQGARSYVRLVGKQVSILNPMLKIYRETKDTVKLSEFLKEYEAYVERRMLDENIALAVNVAKPFTVHIPRGRLMQIVDNLVRNSEYWLQVPAAQSTVKAPTITIEVSKPTISVFDNGIGVKTEIEDRIFGMFVSDKPKDTGRGLGLFITREILLRYGCDVALSEARNAHGRRYRFDIDLASVTQ